MTLRGVKSTLPDLQTELPSSFFIAFYILFSYCSKSAPSHKPKPTVPTSYLSPSTHAAPHIPTSLQFSTNIQAIAIQGSV